MSRSGPVPASPVAHSPAIRSPASTARNGRRVTDAGGSIMERAERRAAAKDLPPSGNHLGPFPSSSLTRLVLPSLSDDHLLNIMSDVGVSVDPEVGSPSSVLSTIRANEMAQAAIAKAKEAVASSAAASVGVRAQSLVWRLVVANPSLAFPGGVLLKDLNPARLLAGRASALRIYLINEGFILEY